MNNDRRPQVSWHAMRRYLERVCEIDWKTLPVDHQRPDADRARVEAAIEHYGIGLDAIETAILTPEVKAAIAMGMSITEVPLEGFFAVVKRGIVVTVKRHRSGRRCSRKMKISGRAETRRRRARLQRRDR